MNFVYLYGFSDEFVSEYNVFRKGTKETFETLYEAEIIGLDTETRVKEDQLRNKDFWRSTEISELLVISIYDKLNVHLFDMRYVDINSFFFLEKKTILGQNLTYDLRFFFQNGIKIKNVIDVMVNECFLFQGNISSREKEETDTSVKVDLASLIQRYCGITISKDVRATFSVVRDKPMKMSHINYCMSDVRYLFQIYEKQLQKIVDNKLENRLKLESTLVPILALTEMKGLKLNPEKWKLVEKENFKKLGEQQAIIDKHVVDNFPKYIKTQLDFFSEEKKCSISWSSSKQVMVLFDELKITMIKRDKKSGEFRKTIEAKEIRKYKGAYEYLVNDYIKYKEIEQSVDTFGLKFLNNINPITKRVHSSFWQIVDTGRMSSSSPNINNIPKEEIYRSCFGPEEGSVFVVCDFSQQEPRITADKSQDPKLRKLFLEGDGDLHSLVASEISEMVYGQHIKVDKKNNPFLPKFHKTLRDVGKAINLGLDYGKSAYSLKFDLNCTDKEAQQIIDKVFGSFNVKVAYFERVSKEAFKTGKIKIDNVTNSYRLIDYYGRFRELSAFKDAGQLNKKEREEYYVLEGRLKRDSQNTPIQGTAAFMTKTAVVLISKAFENFLIPANIVNIVHDEIVVECKEEYAEQVLAIMKESMEKAGKTFCPSIPMKVDSFIGKVWHH